MNIYFDLSVQKINRSNTVESLDFKRRCFEEENLAKRFFSRKDEVERSERRKKNSFSCFFVDVSEKGRTKSHRVIGISLIWRLVRKKNCIRTEQKDITTKRKIGR